MNKSRTISVLSQVDVHAARMYTREMARLIGLELYEQAQISMAVSSLAECLKMAPAAAPLVQPEAASQISIQVADFGRHRLMVDFQSPPGESSANLDNQIKRFKGLVDEIWSERLPDGSIHISMSKWGR